MRKSSQPSPRSSRRQSPRSYHRPSPLSPCRPPPRSLCRPSPPSSSRPFPSLSSRKTPSFSRRPSPPSSRRPYPLSSRPSSPRSSQPPFLPTSFLPVSLPPSHPVAMPTRDALCASQPCTSSPDQCPPGNHCGDCTTKCGARSTRFLTKLNVCPTASTKYVLAGTGDAAPKNPAFTKCHEPMKANNSYKDLVCKEQSKVNAKKRKALPLF